MSIYTDDTVKRLRFFNGDIEITEYVIPKSLKIQDYLCTGQLNFGEANSAKIQFKTSEDLQLTGSRILITFGTDEESAPVGTYKVTYSSHKANTTEVTITAYDAVKEFDKNIAQWYNALSWPITLGTFRKSLCDYIGIEAVETSLVNDTVQLEETIAPSSLNGIEMLFYIGQLNGVFAHANSDYKIEWVNLGTTVNEIPKSVTYGPKAYEAKSYNTAPIGGLIIRQEDGDVGVSFGTSNKYVVQGNVLVYGCSTDELNIIANRLYEKIKDIQYVPCSIKLKYLPDIKMGSRCSYEGNVFYVMQRSTSGLLFDSITAGGNEYLESDTSIETELEQLRGKSNVLNRKIEQTQSTISDVEKGLQNQITQNAEKFSVELEALQSQVDGDIKQYNLDYEPTLTNYPAWDFTYNIPCNDTVQVSDDLAFIYKDSYYSRNARTIVFDTSTSTTYRFVNEDGNWFWKSIGDTEYGIAMSKIASLEVTTENISSSVSSLDYKITNEYITTENCKSLITQSSTSIKQEVSAEYAKKSLLNDYSTTVKMNAAINLAVDGIKHTVSESYATKTSLSETQQLADKINWLVKSGDSSSNMVLTSELYNVLTENITLKGKHIQLDGDTTVGTGFELSCDVLNGGTINGQILNGCTMSGGAISIGGNNIIMNEAGFWIIGNESAQAPSFAVNNLGQISQYSGGIRRFFTNGHMVTGTVVTSDAQYSISSNWYSICSAGNNTSDKRQKNTIKPLNEDAKMESFFDNLKPCSFFFNKGTGYIETQKHIGFIAQDVEDDIKAAGFEEDLAVFDHLDEEKLGINKQEIIALNTWQIQKLKSQLKSLMEKITVLECGR